MYFLSSNLVASDGHCRWDFLAGICMPSCVTSTSSVRGATSCAQPVSVVGWLSFSKVQIRMSSAYTVKRTPQLLWILVVSPQYEMVKKRGDGTLQGP